MGSFEELPIARSWLSAWTSSVATTTSTSYCKAGRGTVVRGRLELHITSHSCVLPYVMDCERMSFEKKLWRQMVHARAEELGYQRLFLLLSRWRATMPRSCTV